MIKVEMKKGLRYGFTLVELLVVIAIIGILSIVAVSQFNTAKVKARDTQRKADLDSVAKAINMYAADYGVFPEQEKIGWGGVFVDDASSSEPYYYMRVLPTENHLDTEFCYLPATDLKSYLLFGNMEGEGMVTGDYGVTDLGCGNSDYNFAIAGPNTTIDEFCNTYSNLCSVGELVTGGENMESTPEECESENGTCASLCLGNTTGFSQRDCPAGQICCVPLDNF